MRSVHANFNRSKPKQTLRLILKLRKLLLKLKNEHLKRIETAMKRMSKSLCNISDQHQLNYSMFSIDKYLLHYVSGML